MPIQKAYPPQWSPFSQILLEYSFSWELARVEFGSSLWSPITQCGGNHWEEVSGCYRPPLGLISEVHGFQGNAAQKPNALHCLAQLDVQPKVGFSQINKWEYLSECKPFHRINPASLAAKLWALIVIANILKVETKRILEESENNGHYTKWQRRKMRFWLTCYFVISGLFKNTNKLGQRPPLVGRGQGRSFPMGVMP